MEGQEETSDVSVVEHIANGDTSAEATLYGRFAARVYHVALRELRSPAEAEDVRTETFIRVLTAIRQKRLRAAEALAGYILATAHNVIREFRRARQRADAVAEESAKGEATVDTVFEDEDTAAAIEHVIGRLRPRERTVLRLLYYEDVPKDEVARRLGIERERLRLVKSRALKSFRESYARLTSQRSTSR